MGDLGTASVAAAEGDGDEAGRGDIVVVWWWRVFAGLVIHVVSFDLIAITFAGSVRQFVVFVQTSFRNLWRLSPE